MSSFNRCRCSHLHRPNTTIINSKSSVVFLPFYLLFILFHKDNYAGSCIECVQFKCCLFSFFIQIHMHFFSIVGCCFFSPLLSAAFERVFMLSAFFIQIAPFSIGCCVNCCVFGLSALNSNSSMSHSHHACCFYAVFLLDRTEKTVSSSHFQCFNLVELDISTR